MTYSENTIEHLLLSGVALLHGSSETPRLDAEILLSTILSCDRLSLILKRSDVVSEIVRLKYESLLERRKNSEPIAYITGIKEFWGLDFAVDNSVLIPRPETELVVELAIAELAKTSGHIKICDLGTGSGAIIIAIAHELKKSDREFSATAIDISEAALKVAKMNAITHGLSDSISFLKSNWLECKGESEHFDLIVANPPYIALHDDRVSKSTTFEPVSALFAGEDGLDAFRYIFKDLLQSLKKGGSFISEIGFDQKDSLTELLPRYFHSMDDMKVMFHKDLAQNDRVLSLNL